MKTESPKKKTKKKEKEEKEKQFCLSISRLAIESHLPSIRNYKILQMGGFDHLITRRYLHADIRTATYLRAYSTWTYT